MPPRVDALLDVVVFLAMLIVAEPANDGRGDRQITSGSLHKTLMNSVTKHTPTSHKPPASRDTKHVMQLDLDIRCVSRGGDGNPKRCTTTYVSSPFDPLPMPQPEIKKRSYSWRRRRHASVYSRGRLDGGAETCGRQAPGCSKG